jgi:hypothetical protein
MKTRTINALPTAILTVAAAAVPTPELASATNVTARY